MRQVAMGLLVLLAATARPASEIVVVPPAQGAPAELHAAEVLAKYLTKITGQPVVESSTAKGATRIVVGATPEAKELCPDIAWGDLGMEEVVIRTVGSNIVVAGGKPRGTMYAAYRLLARLGVRWWTPWAVEVPSKPKLTLPTFNVREAPAFEYREPYWFDAFDPEWQAANGANGPLKPLDEAHGGRVEYEGFVHTFYGYAPPEKYFATHPEWYSLVNGQRVDHNAQLCTTNPELRQLILDQVRQKLRANPKATIVSVSQNDCYNPCQCDRCQALAKAEGSESAPLIDLANFVADGIKGEFPNVAIDTLAYQYSRHAPKTLRPRPNVIVRLCSIECDFGVPLTDPRNKDFANDIRDWSRLTHRLYVWDYVTNFSHYVQPFPNVQVLGPNLKFFADNGVKGVFEEGDYTSTGGDMAELKAWMLAQLMWDPSQDPIKLRNEFLAGYYGPYGEAIGRYLDQLALAAKSTPVRIWDGPGSPYLDVSQLKSALALESVPSGNPVYRARAAYALNPARYVLLHQWKAVCEMAMAKSGRWPEPGSRKKLAQEWLSTASTPGLAGNSPMTAIDEGGASPATFVNQVSVEILPPPARHAASLPIGIAPGWIDAQDNLAGLWNDPVGATLAPDPSASDGAACKMPGTHHEWAFKTVFEHVSDRLATGKWKVYVVARVDSDVPAPVAFSTGIYSDDTQSSVAAKEIAGSDASSVYHTYELGVFKLPTHGYVWVAPPGDGTVRALWVDRVYFVPAN